MKETYRKKQARKRLAFRKSLNNRNENIIKDFQCGFTFLEIGEEHRLHHWRCRQIVQEILKDQYLPTLVKLSTARSKAKILNNILELKADLGRLPISTEIQTHFGRNYKNHFTGITEIRKLLS